MASVNYVKLKRDLKDFFTTLKCNYGMGHKTQLMEESLRQGLKKLPLRDVKDLYAEFVFTYSQMFEGMTPLISAQNTDAMQIHIHTVYACSKVLELLESARFDTGNKDKVVKNLSSMLNLNSAMLEYSEYCAFNSRKCKTDVEKRQFDDIEKELSAILTLKYIERQRMDKARGDFPIEEAVAADQEYRIMQRCIDRYSGKLKNIPKKVDFMYFDEDNRALQQFANKLRNFAFIQVDKYTNPRYGVQAISAKLREDNVFDNIK